MTDNINSSQILIAGKTEPMTSSQAILVDQSNEKAEEERVKKRDHHRKLFQKYLDNPDVIDEIK